ncbi:unnamed protein product, partial [Choristocarpus tenellus]
LDICSSRWASVENMARQMAEGTSISSTIRRCHSLPRLLSQAGQQITTMGSERLHFDRTGLCSSYSLHLRALMAFRRLGTRPQSQPEVFFLDASNLPSALASIDPTLTEAAVVKWMEANGYGQVNARISLL